MSTTTQSKCYSLDNEEFNHDSLGDLLDSMIEPAVGDVYYEADCRPFTNADVVSRHEVDSILERLDEQAYEEIGEVFDNEFSNVTQEAKAELLALLTAWADKHVSLEHYWKITGKSREMKLTAEELP
ncbi:hypothetical protein [Curvibacter lanceolatus]|uniref:hypothetical protein n=1 Tax=Curvibacter lanceolatus TaxID=86182 RepID=UPI00037FEA74|nr:hypothetical protein [Curvibacter lanceolatus]